MIPVEKALKIVMERVSPIQDTEDVGLLSASGRILAEDIASDIDISPFDKSAMDGYAVISELCPGEFEIIEEIPAGHVPKKEVAPGRVSKIMTGAPIPKGADSVVMKEDTEDKGEKVSITAMSRSSGRTAFSFLREAIERKVVGSQDALENLDAVSDVRRLQIFVDELLQTDSRARDELIAKAAAPSSSYVIGSTIMGSAFRFLSVVAISFMMMSPSVFLFLLNPPIGIQTSLAVLQPEIVLLFLVPIVLLFPFAAMVISWFSKREILEEAKLTKEEKEAQKRRKKELDMKKKEAARRRKEREKARKRMKGKPEEKDEWDKALEDTYKT